MAWLVDAKKWDDAWHRGLIPYGKIVFDCCLTGRLRTGLPGLIANATPVTFADGIGGCTAEEIYEAFTVLEAPDREGQRHFYWDRVYRVIRLPAAPKYNKADNPNVLFSWWKLWCDTPNSDLKWDHLESIKLGVNDHKESMVDCWNDTFGRALKELQAGRKLITYAELGGRRPPGRQGRETPSHGTRNGSGKGLGVKPPNGSGNRLNGSALRSEREFEIECESESESESEYNRLGNGLPDHTNTSNLDSSQKQQEKVQHGRKTPTHEPVGVPGGRHPDPPDPESHPSTASPARRREFELAGWKLSRFGLWIPPGLQ